MSDAAAKPSRWRMIALVISLALNVLLIAVVTVGVLRSVNRAFIAQPGGALSPAAVMRDLPEDRRAAIRDIQLRHREAMRRDRQEARRARIAAFRMFASPNYDPKAFALALGHVQEADGALEAEAIAMVKDVVAALTPEERKQVTEKTRRHGSWMRPELRD